jgi:hypothetical protein
VLWLPRNLPDELMIAGIYVVMGIVMIAAAPDPGKHKAFIDFVILANLLHAAIMAATARNILQIIVDVVPIGAIGILPLIFYPWGIKNYLRMVRRLDRESYSRRSNYNEPNT